MVVMGISGTGNFPGCRRFEANGWHVPLRLVIIRAIIIFMQLNRLIHILFYAKHIAIRFIGN